MEILNKEYGREGDDEEEESGVAGGGASKRQPLSGSEGRYHSLRFVEPGHHELANLQQQQAHSILNELVKRPPTPEETDDDEDDDEEKDDESRDQRATDETAVIDEQEEPIVYPPSTVGEAKTPRLDKISDAEEFKADNSAQQQESDRRQEPVDKPTHESLAQPGHEPEWLEEDRKESERILSKVFDKDHPAREAMSGPLITDTEPGQPPATELTTNPNVSLEPDLTHRVEGFNSEGPGQQYEGYTPGPAQPAENPSPSFREQVDSFERQFTAGAQNVGNVPSPDVITPFAREDTSSLSRRFERLSLRQKETASWLTLVTVAGYFANQRRKHEIAQQEKELKKTAKSYQESTENLAAEQQAMSQRFANHQEQTIKSADYTEYARPNIQSQTEGPASRLLESAGAFKQPALSSAEGGPQSPLYAGEEQKSESDVDAARRAIEEALVPQERPEEHKRVEQDAWLRHVIDDRTGREVQGAVRHGHEYEKERASETKPGAQRQYQPSKGTPGQPTFVGGGYQTHSSQSAYSSQGDQPADSGKSQFDHSLPAGMSAPVDLEHRLPDKERSPVVEALTSPWLFLLLSLLLLAYFIATLF